MQKSALSKIISRYMVGILEKLFFQFIDKLHTNEHHISSGTRRHHNVLDNFHTRPYISSGARRHHNVLGNLRTRP